MTVDPSPTARAHVRWASGFCVLLVLALLLGELPYRGIRHDGILYLGQALSHLNPGWASADLFFAHGSQDQFSVFSRLMAVLLQHLDAGTVDMAVLRGAWVVWLFALYALLRDFQPDARCAALLTVVAGEHFFGSSRTFGFLEPFVTARTWAEPVTVLALVALLRGRWWLAVASFALAIALHPLVALPVCAVALGYLVAVDRRWLAMLLLAVPVVGLAFAGIAPFAALLKTYDPDWFQATLIANDMVYISNWSATDALSPLTCMAVLWLANRGSITPFARLARATIVMAPLLFLVSFIGADLLHDVLITQLQLWRVGWILNLLAFASLPLLLLREWAKGPKGRCAAIAVFVALYAVDDARPSGFGLAAWAGGALVLSASKARIKPWLLAVAVAMTVLAAASVAVLQWSTAHEYLNMHSHPMRAADSFSVAAGLPLVSLPIALGLWLLWRRAGVARLLATLVAVGLLAFVVERWDQRTPWARYVESARPGSHPFAELIPPGAQVYWHEDVLADWVLLQRPHLISNSQSSGLLFNRPTALEAAQRIPPYLAVMAGINKCARLEGLGAVALDRGACELPREAFFALCHARPTHADFLVASTDFGTGVVARWRFTPDDGSVPITYALYDCRKLP